jgi:hypothetical protein
VHHFGFTVLTAAVFLAAAGVKEAKAEGFVAFDGTL